MMKVRKRCCGALEEDGSGICWRVWAPRAERVELVLLNGSQRRVHPMQREEQGFFHAALSDVPEGQRYAYRLNNGPERPDPCSLWQPDGVHNPSAVVRPRRFTWTDQNWKGVPREDLVFYELHTGTFTPEGTFEAIIPRLPALRELGITALELMPVAQFPGPRNWGYDGVHLYAAQNTYGGPYGLQKLVDACHAAGLAIFLDVVYNHLGPEGNYLGEFGPYFTDRYRTSWGPALNYDGHGSDPVRDFILDNVRLWIEDFHFDGLRLDAVHAIFDSRPRHILREIKEVADAAGAGRRVHIIAESLVNDVRMVRAPERGGYGLDAEWNEDFHHALHAHLTGERHGKYSDFGDIRSLARALGQTFHLDGSVYSAYRGRHWGGPDEGLPGDRFVIGVQNHDHVGNRPRGDRLAALVDPAKQRLAASMMLLSPYLPLLFMGEEYGEDKPFPFFCSFHNRNLIENVRQGRRRDYGFAKGVEMLDPPAEATYQAAKLSWSWPEGSHRAGLRRLYADLLAARRNWPALRDFKHRTVRLLPDEQTPVLLHLVRGRGAMGELHAYFNLTEQWQPLPTAAPKGRAMLFSSETVRYHGGRQPGMDLEQLRPYECVVL
jgi:maltooligosyltrehalose trehalohydrolase